ncbi:GNAT family N-acetyltransferase [Paenibacillus sp. PK4536]|uniref:GNAT family N-acetyltransferase n=1 Tax=Paenibacillus sp. PK4536 TaxID=3024576 RepID=UPI0023582C82|nr:GNAT family N-acetyltransferase [Paenibacillus sp. PK4536]WIM38858.1 GNAT family N-acetyltransferase [Paenibacillus sp. PK4536]
MEHDTSFTSQENIFTINCEDVILREFTVNDLDAFHSLTWQPEIYKYLPDWNVSKEQRKDWLVNYEIPENKKLLDAISQGFGIGDLCLRLGIILKETQEFIGWCCSGIKEELSPPNREIVYAISKDYRGKGYTTQAAKGIINYLFENTNVEILSSIALLNNISSNKVIEKSGFIFQNIIKIDDKEYNYYQLHKKDRADVL